VTLFISSSVKLNLLILNYLSAVELILEDLLNFSSPLRSTNNCTWQKYGM